MPDIQKQTLIGQGWKEYDSGLPADLFYSGDTSATPWKVMPHLHLNYSMSGALQSLTYKNEVGQNVYIFKHGVWSANPFGITSQAILGQITFLRNLP